MIETRTKQILEEVIPSQTQLEETPIEKDKIELDNSLVSEVEEIVEEKFRNRQTGKLIAKLIAIVRTERHHNLAQERNRTIRSLIQYSADTTGNSLTRFVAQLYTHKREQPEPYVEALLKRLNPVCKANPDEFFDTNRAGMLR